MLLFKLVWDKGHFREKYFDWGVICEVRACEACRIPLHVTIQISSRVEIQNDHITSVQNDKRRRIPFQNSKLAIIDSVLDMNRVLNRVFSAALFEYGLGNVDVRLG